MVKWTAVIIPLALATAAYLFYSRHQGSAASTASRNENLPDDKDDEDFQQQQHQLQQQQQQPQQQQQNSEQKQQQQQQLGNSRDRGKPSTSNANRLQQHFQQRPQQQQQQQQQHPQQQFHLQQQQQPRCEDVLARLTYLIKKQFLSDGNTDLSKIDRGLLELLHLTAQDIVVLRRNQEKVKREKEAQNSMISKPIFSGLPPPPVDGVNCRWVCDNITTTSTEDHKVIEEEETEEQVEELEETQKSTEFVEQTTLKSAEKNVKVEYEYEKEFNFDQKVETSTQVEIVSSTPVPETKKVDLQMEKEIIFDRNEEEEEEEVKILSSTAVPSTSHPTTPHPTTPVSTTPHPTTSHPTTFHPTTKHPTTPHPTTPHPTTKIPTTPAPTTQHPTTKIPSTELPTTELPTTKPPSTPAPTTPFQTSTVKITSPPLPSSSTADESVKLDFESDNEFDFEQDNDQLVSTEVSTPSSLAPTSSTPKPTAEISSTQKLFHERASTSAPTTTTAATTPSTTTSSKPSTPKPEKYIQTEYKSEYETDFEIPPSPSQTALLPSSTPQPSTEKIAETFAPTEATTTTTAKEEQSTQAQKVEIKEEEEEVSTIEQFEQEETSAESTSVEPSSTTPSPKPTTPVKIVTTSQTPPKSPSTSTRKFETPKNKEFQGFKRSGVFTHKVPTSKEEQTTQKMKVVVTTTTTATPPPETPSTTEAQKFIKTEFEEEKEFNFENYEETTKGENEGSTKEISMITESYSESTLGSPTSTTKKPAERTLVVTDEKEEFNDFEEKEDQKVSTEKIVVEVPSSTPSISTTTKPSLEKLNYEAEKEFNFESQDDEATQEEELITTSTSPPPTVPELPIYTSPSTEKPIPISSTTPKPSLEKLNYETENEVNFEQDETQQKQEEQIKTSSSPKLPAFTSTTKQAIKTSTTTTSKPSVERLNYVDENEQTFDQNESQKQDEQIKSSSKAPPKLPIFTPSTEKLIEISTTTTTSKPSFEKLDFESENEMNFDQDETQKPSEPIKTSKSPIFARTTEKSIKSPSTTPKPAFKNVNFETGKPFNFEQYETQKPEEQIIRTSSPKIPTFSSTTKKTIKSPSTTTSKPSFKNVHFETGKPFNFEQYETQKPEEQIRISSPKVPELPTFTFTTEKSTTKSSSTTEKPSLEKLNYNSENEMNFEDNKQEQIITTSSSKSPKQTTTKKSSTKSTTSKIEKLNYETENEINFEQEETTKKEKQIKASPEKLPIFTTEHSTFKTSTTPKSAFEKLDYNTENEMTFEQDENVQKQEQQTETSSSKVSHFTTSTVEKLSTTSTTPKPSLVEKLNYNTENEMNFEQDENTQKNEEQLETSTQKLLILMPSTEKIIPSPSSTTNLFEKLDFESDQEFDFEQDDAQKQEKQIETASSKVPIFTVSTEQSSKVSTTAKPAFKNINFETEKEDQFQRDETQKQKQQIISTTKKSVKKSSTTTTQQSLEKLNYNTENEMTFEQDETQKQIKTSSSEAPNLPVSTEQPVYLSPTTAKSPFEKLNYESENEMNFEQDEAQKEIKTSSSSKAPKLPTTTKKSGTKSTTTSKSSFEKLDYNTENEMTFGQEESIQKQKQLTETSSQKVPKLPIFPPITEKSITESLSTTTELFQKLNYESDQEFNFAEEGGEKGGKSKVDENSSSTNKQSELTKVDTQTTDQKSTDNIIEKANQAEKQSSVKGKTAQNLVSGEEKSSAFKEKSSTSKVKATKSTTTKATEPPQNQAFKKLDYQSDDSYNFETETAKNNNNNNKPAVESRSNVNVKTEASTTATAASSSSTNNSNRKSANQQVNVQQSIENHSDLFHQAIDVTGDGDKNKKKMKKKKVVVANILPSQAKSYSNAFNNFKQRVQTTSTGGGFKNSAAADSARAMKYESGQNFKNFGERSQFFGGSAGAATTAKSAAESFSGSGSKVKNGTFSFSKKVVNSENSGGAGKSSKTFSGSSGGRVSELTGVNRKLIQEKSVTEKSDLESGKNIRANYESEDSFDFGEGNSNSQSSSSSSSSSSGSKQESKYSSFGEESSSSSSSFSSDDDDSGMMMKKKSNLEKITRSGGFTTEQVVVVPVQTTEEAPTTTEDSKLLRINAEKEYSYEF